MTATTAEVKTLTAEVRVLQVGNRQITKSIAKQLDRVHITDLSVWGRINLGDEKRGTGTAIGTDAAGNLVTASYQTFSAPEPPMFPLCDLPEGTFLCNHVPVSTWYDDEIRGYRVLVSYDGLEFWIDLGKRSGWWTHRPSGIATCAYHECQCGDRRFELGGGNGAELREFVAELSEHYDYEAARIAASKSAAEAPLIVLAGLR